MAISESPQAEPAPPSEDFVRKTELVRIIDGDTLRLRIDLGWMTSIEDDIRLAFLNTPEPRGPERSAGKWVTEQVHRWVSDTGIGPVMIHSREFSRGKFGRCLCSVWIAGKSLNQWLLDRKYAWPANNHGQIVGPRDIGRLAIPDEIKAEVARAA